MLLSGFVVIVYNAVSLLNFLFFSLFYMETYKHILEILTINKVCLFMSYDTMDYLVLCNMV